MAKLRRGHEFAKTRSIRLFGWLCGCEQYRGREGQAGSDDALHFTVLPRDRRIWISQSKLSPCTQFQKKAHSSMHLSLGWTDRGFQTDSMSWMTAVFEMVQNAPRIQHRF